MLKFADFINKYGLSMAHFARLLEISRSGLLYHARVDPHEMSPEIARDLARHLRKIGKECIEYADELKEIARDDK